MRLAMMPAAMFSDRLLMEVERAGILGHEVHVVLEVVAVCDGDSERASPQVWQGARRRATSGIPRGQL